CQGEGVQLHGERAETASQRLCRAAPGAEHSQPDEEEGRPLMTQRERQRMKIIAIAAGIFGAGLVIYMTFLGPYLAGQDELARLEEDTHEKDRLIAQKKKERQQVERFRFMSLVGPQNEAVIHYDKFLQQTLKASGLASGAEIQVPASEAKQAAAQGGKKPPPHTALTFIVVSRGELAT